MAIEQPRYISFAEAVKFHILYMRKVGEIRFGVYDRGLIESALARPRIAFEYENADLVRQAATLCFGLIKNHPWEGGNKRTATLLTYLFLKRNRLELTVITTADLIDLSLNIEADKWKVDEIENWLRKRVTTI